MARITLKPGKNDPVVKLPLTYQLILYVSHHEPLELTGLAVRSKADPTNVIEIGCESCTAKPASNNDGSVIICFILDRLTIQGNNDIHALITGVNAGTQEIIMRTMLDGVPGPNVAFETLILYDLTSHSIKASTSGKKSHLETCEEDLINYNMPAMNAGDESYTKLAAIIRDAIKIHCDGDSAVGKIPMHAFLAGYLLEHGVKPEKED